MESQAAKHAEGSVSERREGSASELAPSVRSLAPVNRSLVPSFFSCDPSKANAQAANTLRYYSLSPARMCASFAQRTQLFEKSLGLLRGFQLAPQPSAPVKEDGSD